MILPTGWGLSQMFLFRKLQTTKPQSLLQMCPVEALGRGYFFEHLIRFVFLPTLQSPFGWLSQPFVLRKLQNAKPHSLS
jgi:hypothetical protein